MRPLGAFEVCNHIFKQPLGPNIDFAYYQLCGNASLTNMFQRENRQHALSQICNRQPLMRCYIDTSNQGVLQFLELPSGDIIRRISQCIDEQNVSTSPDDLEGFVAHQYDIFRVYLCKPKSYLWSVWFIELPPLADNMTQLGILFYFHHSIADALSVTETAKLFIHYLEHTDNVKEINTVIPQSREMLANMQEDDFVCSDMESIRCFQRSTQRPTGVLFQTLRDGLLTKLLLVCKERGASVSAYLAVVASIAWRHLCERRGLERGAKDTMTLAVDLRRLLKANESDLVCHTTSFITTANTHTSQSRDILAIAVAVTVELKSWLNANGHIQSLRDCATTLGREGCITWGDNETYQGASIFLSNIGRQRLPQSELNIVRHFRGSLPSFCFGCYTACVNDDLSWTLIYPSWAVTKDDAVEFMAEVRCMLLQSVQ